MDLFQRHIQDHNEANTTTRKYWGYPSRVLPCTKDAGTCEYLDAVYKMHDTSMLYTFILWAVILGVLLLLAMDRLRRQAVSSQGKGGMLDEIADCLAIFKRKLLPDAPMRWLFGRVSRLQVVVLAVLLGYLLVFSLIGIVYRTWVTPISGSNLFNTRTGLGGWSDRIGALAYALTPLAVLLCQRESLLSLITGIPYQHFNFLHRWLGRIIFVQSFLHTLGWTIVEAKLYQPQPSVYVTFMKQQYVIFGVVAMFFITWLTVFSTKKAIEWTGYEFFKITHWIVAVLYVAACWGHWDKLYCWMVPSLALVFLDQAVRYARTAYLHYHGKQGGFQCSLAKTTVFNDNEGTVVRLDIPTNSEGRSNGTWQPGQHFYLTFPSLSIWQSHPFTVSSLPEENTQTYLIRVRTGQTRLLAAALEADMNTLPVILTGPYGKGFPSWESEHILAVAGGTGVTFTLPIIQAALRDRRKKKGVLDFIWIVRKRNDLYWLHDELVKLREHFDDYPGLRINIFVTRDSASSSSPDNGKEKISTITTIEDLTLHPRFNIHNLQTHHPSIEAIVADFHNRTINTASGGYGAMEILGSGPETMGSDLRAAVAALEGREEEVEFYWDSRE